MLNSRATYDTLNATTITDIWLKDLEQFEAEYTKYLQQRAVKQSGADETSSKAPKKISVQTKKK